MAEIEQRRVLGRGADSGKTPPVRRLPAQNKVALLATVRSESAKIPPISRP